MISSQIEALLRGATASAVGAVPVKVNKNRSLDRKNGAIAWVA
ncbi:MAG: hypothetical protein ACFHX7_05125 [Pseudomonadota bacterium]